MSNTSGKIRVVFVNQSFIIINADSFELFHAQGHIAWVSVKAQGKEIGVFPGATVAAVYYDSHHGSFAQYK